MLYWGGTQSPFFFAQTLMKKRHLIAIAIVPFTLLVFATIRDSCANPSYAQYMQESCQQPKWHLSLQIGWTIIHLKPLASCIMRSWIISRKRLSKRCYQSMTNLLTLAPNSYKILL
jgi:hypothetical protein